MKRLLISILMVGLFSSVAASAEEPNLEQIYLQNAAATLSKFIASPQGSALFNGLIDLSLFQTEASRVYFTLSNEPLFDRFSQPRCLLNGRIEHQILVSESAKCTQFLQAHSPEMYATLFHEILNQADVELPTARIGSRYDDSKKLLEVPVEDIEGALTSVLHPTCALSFSFSDGFKSGLPRELIPMLTALGYHFVFPGESEEAMELQIVPILPAKGSLRSASEHRLRLDFQTRLALRGAVAESSNFFLSERRIEGLLDVWTSRSGESFVREVLSPAQVARALILQLPNCTRILKNPERTSL